uniref:Protein lifeguard 1 n=1 Tax=Anthurium amnicola TaxID=1678845 RepID=A0A1D1XZT6_9ARAE
MYPYPSLASYHPPGDPFYAYAAAPPAAASPSSMSIQGHLLEVTVVGCNRLRDTEWISRQDPYVCLEYASTKFRTRTCTDGGKNPTFQEKFVFNLIEGLREISVAVWNSNTLTFDDFIGSGRVQLHKVLSQGYDDTPWTIQGKSGKYAGEITLIMHYSNVQNSGKSYVPTAPPYAAAAPPQAPAFPYAQPYPTPAYAPPPAAYHPAPAGYPPAPTPSYPSYPPAAPYPASPYLAAPPAYPPQGYPPAPYPAPAAQTYPPPTYPPAPGNYSTYPPPPY